jgi:allantoin racemase
MTRGSCFGVISILHNSVARHRRHLRERRLDHLCAGDRPLGLSVAQVASGDNTYERMLTVGTALRDDDGAEVIIMGCAGMARHREPLQDALGMPVIDPTQAATSMAIGAVSLAR